MSGWAVVMTKPNSEMLAVINLKRQGYRCYFPRLKVLQKATSVIKPLFPRYIFVFIEKRWYSINGTRGVSYVLLGDEGPAYLPQLVITSLKAKEDNEGLINLGKVPAMERFQPGEHVTALSGPLTGIDMLYEGMVSNERVRVLATLLGRTVSVTLDEKLLVPDTRENQVGDQK